MSAYALTVEPATPLGWRVASGETPGPDDDDQARKYELADDALETVGLRSYEISSWARPGEECRHNLLYWEQGDYLAIGCAAHGHRAGERWWNLRTPERYMRAIAEHRSPRAGSEVLDATARAEEALVLALRTRAGARVMPACAAVVDELETAGMIDRVDDRVTLTRSGRLLANDVTVRLLAAGAAGSRYNRVLIPGGAVAGDHGG